MSCGFCCHWIEDPASKQPPRREGESWFKRWERRTGECALHPQRQKTTTLYFCSQLRLEDPSLPGTLRGRLDEQGDEIRHLYQRIKALEARKKVLNAKIRELRNG